MLAHFIEEAGIPTAGISLIRSQTEALRPPRALWVPFQFGRPLGAPNDIPFQKRVLTDLLNLFQAAEGPVLADFPEDEPGCDDDIAVLACPVNFLPDDESGEADPLRAAFLRELMTIRPWYDTARHKRRRTTVGVSGIDIDGLGEFVYAFLEDTAPVNPREDITLPLALKLAVEDLKAYYNEGIMAQPGQENLSGNALKNWFWDTTVAGKVLIELVKRLEKDADPDMAGIAAHSLAPRDVIRRNKP